MNPCGCFETGGIYSIFASLHIYDHHEGNEAIFGDTPLLIAVMCGELEIVRLLINGGANVNGQGGDGYTPLMQACMRRRSSIVQLLIANGADPNILNDNGDTALIFGVDGRIEHVDWLLNKGADVNAGTGWTPLMRATSGRRSAVVKLLLQAGADPNLRRYGMTAFECAKLNGSKSIAAILEQAGAVGRSRDELAKWIRQAARDEKKADKTLREEWSELARQILTVDDQEIINVVLQDVLAEREGEFDGFISNGDRLILSDNTEEHHPFDLEEEVNNGLTLPQANEISMEMRDDLVRRNTKAVSLSTFQPTAGAIRVEAIPKNACLGDRNSDAWAYVTLRLPGCSKDGNRAVLRFTISAYRTSAGGTYYLVKSADGWQVKWREIGFYCT